MSNFIKKAWKRIIRLLRELVRLLTVSRILRLLDLLWLVLRITGVSHHHAGFLLSSQN